MPIMFVGIRSLSHLDSRHKISSIQSLPLLDRRHKIHPSLLLLPRDLHMSRLMIRFASCFMVG
jgi:hypothetical protein